MKPGVAEVEMGPLRPALPTLLSCCQESGSRFHEVVVGSAWLAEGADVARPVLSSMESTSSRGLLSTGNATNGMRTI